MRTLPTTLAITMLLAAPLSAQTQPRVPDRCAPTAGIVDYRGAAPTIRKLGEMPPASQIYSVYSVVEGCPQPVVVRRGIGGNPAQRTSPTRSPPRAMRAN